MRNGLIEEVTRYAGQNDQEDGIHFEFKREYKSDAKNNNALVVREIFFV